MSLGAHPSPDPYLDPHDQFRHDLKTPLTTISGRAQLLTRMVRRSSSLTELERGTMLDGLATIETTVRGMVTRFDARERIDRSGEPHRTLADQLRSFLSLPDHVIGLADDQPLLVRLDTAFFLAGEASGALLVKFIGGETESIDELRGGLQRNGLDVARLEADGRFLWSPGIQPSQERDGPLQSLLIEAVRARRPVWASFNWTKPVELETMLRQQVELGALADAAQLVVKTAAVQRVADWSAATRQRASAFPRSMVTIAPDGLTLSRGVPLPALYGVMVT